MNRDDAIRKIKACLALSKSANPGEAAAALRQARKLADQLGIDEGEVRPTALAAAFAPDARYAGNQHFDAWRGF